MPPGFEAGPPIRCPAPPADGCPVLPISQALPGEMLFRVCSDSRAIRELDARASADYRFSPLLAPDGSIAPVYYTAFHPRAALAETVLRHRYAQAPGTIYRRDLEGKQLVQLEVQRPIPFVPLFGPAAQKLGYNTATAIAQADAGQYPMTRAWAAALFVAHPDAEAIGWISAQDLEQKNLMLWQRAGGRSALEALRLVEEPISVLHPAVLGQIADVAAMTGHVLDLS